MDSRTAERSWICRSSGMLLANCSVDEDVIVRGGVQVYRRATVIMDYCARSIVDDPHHVTV